MIDYTKYEKLMYEVLNYTSKLNVTDENSFKSHYKSASGKEQFLLFINKHKELAANISSSGYFLAIYMYQKNLHKIIQKDDSKMKESFKSYIDNPLIFLSNEKINSCLKFFQDSEKTDKRDIKYLYHSQIIIKELIILKNYAEIFKLKHNME